MSDKHPDTSDPEHDFLCRHEAPTRKTKEHDWTIEDIIGGPEGGGEFYRCAGCDAAGGPLTYRPGEKPPTFAPFLPSIGPGVGPINVGMDCEYAKKKILEIRGRAARVEHLIQKEIMPRLGLINGWPIGMGRIWEPIYRALEKENAASITATYQPKDG